MSEKTPERAAYEAYYGAVATLPGILLPSWDELVGAEHRAWEAAAQAAIATVVNPTAEDYDNAAEILQLRDQLAAADRATAEFRRQCSELAGELGAARAVVREMCGVLAEYGEGGQDNDQIVQWRQCAGIEEH